MSFGNFGTCGIKCFFWKGVILGFEKNLMFSIGLQFIKMVFGSFTDLLAVVLVYSLVQ
jgi:hypothetical protein